MLRSLVVLSPLLAASAALADSGDTELVLLELIVFIVVAVAGTMMGFTLCLAAPFFTVMSVQRQLGKSPLILAGLLGLVCAMNLYGLVDDAEIDNHRFVAWTALCFGASLTLALAPFAPRLPALLSFGAAALLTLGGAGYSVNRAGAVMGDPLFGMGAVEGGGLYIAVCATGFALVRRREIGLEGVGVVTLLSVLPLVFALLARPLGYAGG